MFRSWVPHQNCRPDHHGGGDSHEEKTEYARVTRLRAEYRRVLHFGGEPREDIGPGPACRAPVHRPLCHGAGWAMLPRDHR